jgi:hypothetical protein
MSQVFPFRASMIKWALLFKDSWHNSGRLKNILRTQNNCSHLAMSEEAIITAIEPEPIERLTKACRSNF